MGIGEKLTGAIVESMELDGSDKINYNVPLRDIEIESVDVADIMYKVGVNIMRYVQDGKINDGGRVLLNEIASSHAIVGDGIMVYHYLCLQRCDTIKEFLGIAIAEDLEIIMQYEQYKRGAVA